jgi:hypothetical protein
MNQLSNAVNLLRDAQSQPPGPPDINPREEVRRIINAVSNRLRVHDQLEEEQVYKWTDTILTAAEGKRLTAALRHELENMPPRFARPS